MCVMVAGAIGNPDRLEYPPQRERSGDTHHGEDQPKFQVLPQRRLQAKQRKHQHLRGHGHPVTHHDIGDGFEKRHDARLFHCANPSSIVEPSHKNSERMRCNQGNHAVAAKSKPVHPVGQPISASTNRGFKLRR